MEKIIKTTFRLKGTEKEIELIKGKIASLSILEGVVSMYMGGEEQYPV